MFDSYPLRVLAVDDWVDTAESLVVLAELWGHRAVAVSDGRAALERAADFRPHVILLDLRLPDLDGLAVVRLLRAEPTLAGVYIVALSGCDQLRQAALAAGCDRFVLKPPVLAELEALLAERAERIAAAALVSAG